MSATFSPTILPPVPDGAACAVCRAPLGPAARYCLACGERQAAVRAELLDLVVGRVPAARPGAVARDAGAPVGPSASAAPVPPAPSVVPPATVVSAPPAGPRTWPFAVTAAVLVALVVGLVVGRLFADGRDAPAAAPVVRVEPAPAPTGESAADGVPVPALTGEPVVDGVPAPGPAASVPADAAAPAAGGTE